MKDKYEIPNIDIISIEDNDVVVTSICTNVACTLDAGCPEDDSRPYY